MRVQAVSCDGTIAARSLPYSTPLVPVRALVTSSRPDRCTPSNRHVSAGRKVGDLASHARTRDRVLDDRDGAPSQVTASARITAGGVGHSSGIARPVEYHNHKPPHSIHNGSHRTPPPALQISGTAAFHITLPAYIPTARYVTRPGHLHFQHNAIIQQTQGMLPRHDATPC